MRATAFVEYKPIVRIFPKQWWWPNERVLVKKTLHIFISAFGTNKILFIRSEHAIVVDFFLPPNSIYTNKEKKNKVQKLGFSTSCYFSRLVVTLTSE